MAAQKSPVTLKVDGFTDREVASVTYHFDQAVNKENQPAGIPRGGKIVVRVKALNNGNEELLRWMTSETLSKNGSIQFMDSSDSKKEVKSVKFEGAYCIDFIEHWEDKQANEETTLAHWEEITISCRKIVNGQVEYENEWK